METQAEMIRGSLPLPEGAYLGPARILERCGSRWKVALADRAALASLALAVPYEPVAGDVVLAIGTEEVFIIGVLQGSGQTVLQVQGDLELRASGKLRLLGGSDVEIGSPRVRIRADRMETAIGTVVERVIDCYRWVKGLFQTTAGRSRTIVEKSATLHAGRIVEKSKGDVSIDGTQIRLG